MALSWSDRRKLLYYGVAGIASLFVLVAVWQVFFTAAPNCSDRVKNGTELGVDCGGSCALICQPQARSPVVLWSRAFKTDTNLYTAAAYIENPNTALGAGARSVRYSFRLFDDKNILISKRDGVINIPPIALVPIVEHNINVGGRTVARTLFSFSDEPVWSRSSTPAPEVRLSGQALEPDSSRLSAVLTNNSLEPVAQITVVAVLFDAQGVARGASKSTISNLAKKSSQPIVFTWPMGTEGIVRAEMTVLPAF